MKHALPPLTAYTASWLALMGLAMLSFALGNHPGGRWLMAIALVLTLIKGQLISSVFMDLRHAPRVWGRIMSAYLLSIGMIIALSYLST